MELNDLKKALSLLLFALLLGCSSEISNKKELVQYMADQDNGMIKKNSANNFMLTMKYLPAPYLALNELNSGDLKKSNQYELYLKEFQNSRAFLLTIKPENSQLDASEYNVKDLQEYNRRIENLQFNIRNHIYLITDDGERIQPVLSTMENLYEIDKGNSIYLVFADTENKVLKSNELDIVFQDDFIDTGISHFLFEKDNLDNIPRLKF